MLQLNGLWATLLLATELLYTYVPWKTLFKTDQVENENFFTAQHQRAKKTKLLCVPKVALHVSKLTKWLRLFFVPKHHVMLIIVYQTNTGHRESSLYNESNAQNKVKFKCWSCHALNVVHQLPSFCALCFAIFADEVVRLIFVLQTFSWNNSPVYFVCSPLSSLETFWSICVTLCCKRYTARHRT